MTAEREIDYEALAQGAMRGIVRTVLIRVAQSGLPGEHHFYIAFRTDAPGVVLSKRLKEKYPEEMTVVLQHRFWDLAVSEDRFEVKLTFDSIPERLVVPFAAIKVFFDPSVPYGLQFDETHVPGAAATGESGRPARKVAGGEQDRLPAISDSARPEKKPRVRRAPAEKTAAERPAAADKSAARHPTPKAAEPTPGPKVVSIDAFRKK
jgi:hypothetical protein